MKRITFDELCATFEEHNKENAVVSQFFDMKRLTGVIVFKQESWPGAREFSLESRSYRIASDNKYFIPELSGRSLYANSLDGSDKGVRLDWYIGKWIIDYCYIENA